jgi:SPP1 gp7 family putative phage head morphogenesis protein
VEHALADAARITRGAVREEETGSPVLLGVAREADLTAAHLAAASYASAWGAAAMSQALDAPDTPQRPEVWTKAQDHRLRRIAATETARVVSDERNVPGTYRVWSAILDRATCAYCWSQDGKIAAPGERFIETPPVHPFCRCQCLPLDIPLPKRLADIQIDYELFKRELRDVVRERREVSGRHAAAFVRDAMGERRSPIVLTERFRRRAYAR